MSESEDIKYKYLNAVLNNYINVLHDFILPSLWPPPTKSFATYFYFKESEAGSLTVFSEKP